MKARVLLYDVEVSANVGDTWGKYEQNVIQFRRDWYMLCFAYKWLGEKKTHVVALPDFDRYKTDPENDIDVIEKLHKLFNEADIIIGHNSKSFDDKMSQTRMVIHGFDPPLPYKQLDTKQIAKASFRFTSNKLDDLAKFLKLPGKLETGGYGLWLGCEAGDPSAWRKMKKYNKQDVVLLEQVYLRLLPWVKNHPSMAILNESLQGCKNCAGTNLEKRGTYPTNSGIKQMWFCRDCRAWNKTRVTENLRPDFT